MSINAATGELASGLCAKCPENKGKPFVIHPCGPWTVTGPLRYSDGVGLVVIECDLYDRLQSQKSRGETP